MNHPARSIPLYIRFGVLLLAALLLFGLSPLAQSAHAALGDGWHENVVLTGSFTGMFTLDSNTSEIFRVDNAAPGDSWSGTITIRNEARAPMAVALVSIVSELDDLTLYNALNLDIQVGSTTIYSGSYGKTPTPITPFYVVPAGTSLIINSTVAFPAHNGNELMGKEMDSTWTFEARYLEDCPGPLVYPYTVRYIDKETKLPLAPEKIAYAPLGQIVTEHAVYIEGYAPDAAYKTIKIRAKNNVITFYYEKAEVPYEPTPKPIVTPSDPGTTPSDTPSAEPSDPAAEPSTKPSVKPGVVQTGNDLSESNTTPLIYIILVLLCMFAVLVVCLQIRAAKRRRDK